MGNVLISDKCHFSPFFYFYFLVRASHMAKSDVNAGREIKFFNTEGQYIYL